ncbi:hypothetical protein [Oceanisphaera sp. IT1-181]|nr:hypothetical protein [Oceanisphaera sp. IT1-181]
MHHSLLANGKALRLTTESKVSSWLLLKTHNKANHTRQQAGWTR